MSINFNTYSKKLLQNGYLTIPITGKRPLFGNWSRYCSDQLLEPERDRIFREYNPPITGIGLPLGPGNQVIVIDVDTEDPEILKLIERELPNTLIRKKGSKGFSVFFRYNGEISRKIRHENDMYVELLSTGNHTVIPPSIHPDTKKPYSYLTERTLENTSPEELPYLPSDFMDVIEAEIKEKVVKHSDHDKLGTSARNDKLKSIVTAKLNSKVSLDEIINFLIKYDEKNHSPPLFSDPTENNILHDKFTNAAVFTINMLKSISKKRISNGEDPLYENISNSSAERLIISKFSELMKKPPENINYIVEELLIHGGVSIVFAKPKVGKSTLVRFMMIIISRGEKLFGRSTEKSRILYLALEEIESEIIKAFKMLGANEQSEIFVHSGPITKDQRDSFEEAIIEIQPRLVVIDTLNAFLKIEDTNDYGTFTTRIEPFIKIARQHKVHILFIHHSRKSDQNGFDSMLGSTAIFGSVDAAIKLTQDESGNRYIESIQRYGKNLEKSLIEFDETTKTFELLGSSKELNINRLKNDIEVKLLIGESNLDDLKESITGKASEILKALGQLISEGRVIKEGKGVKGNPHIYRIRDSNPNMNI